MSEHDNPDPVEPDSAAAPTTPPAATPSQPIAADAKPRWGDRLFRMRAVGAVAVAGVILGAAGGAVTTALVTGDDHGGHPERFRIGPAWQPGMPVVPPNGREGFPGDEPDGNGLPGMPGSDSGTDQGGSLSQG